MGQADKQLRILLITRKDLLIDVLSVFLEGRCRPELAVAESPEQLKLRLDEKPCFDLVVLEDEAILRGSGKTLGDFLAPAIVIGTPLESLLQCGRRLARVPRPVSLEQLGQAFEELASELALPPMPEFCPVRLEVLVLHGRPLRHPLYRQQEQGFAVLIPEGKTIDLSDETFAGLSSRKYLFLRKEHFPAFVRDLAASLQGGLGKELPLFDLSAATRTTLGVHELLVLTMPELGFTPQLQTAVRISLDLAIRSIRKNPELSSLLAALLRQDAGYLSWHSTALCFLACRFSSLMSWDSANAHYKLSLAAFLLPGAAARLL